MRTAHRPRGLSTRSHRTLPPHRVLRPVAGQCFEIEIRQDGNRFIIGIPEIDRVTWAHTRSGVELAARECIAAHTGIPLGYISVWSRD
jgi:hypothetical protein